MVWFFIIQHIILGNFAPTVDCRPPDLNRLLADLGYGRREREAFGLVPTCLSAGFIRYTDGKAVHI